MLSINGYVPSENEVIFERFISTNFQNSNRFLLYVPLSATQETKVVKIRVIGCHNLAKKDIFGASDPYVKISLVNVGDNNPIDTAYTKTKKRVIFIQSFSNAIFSISFINFNPLVIIFTLFTCLIIGSFSEQNSFQMEIN